MVVGPIVRAELLRLVKYLIKLQIIIRICIHSQNKSHKAMSRVPLDFTRLGSTLQSSGCTATYHPSRKLSKLDETRHAEHCWRSKDELISDVLLWTPSHGRAKAGRPARTYILQLCADTGCSPKDLTIEKGGDKGPGISLLMARHDGGRHYVTWKQYQNREWIKIFRKFFFSKN